jgi:mitochondrial fission protein ELM1
MAFVAPTDTPDSPEAQSPLRAGGGHIVAGQIRKSGIGRAEFDGLVVFKHDRLRGPEVIAIRAAVHRVAQARLRAERHRFPALAAMPWPIPSALISRTNRAYRSTPRRSDESNATLARFHEAMKAAGITLPFSGGVEGCSNPSPDATTGACIKLQILVLGRRKWS